MKRDNLIYILCLADITNIKGMQFTNINKMFETFVNFEIKSFLSSKIYDPH